MEQIKRHPGGNILLKLTPERWRQHTYTLPGKQTLLFLFIATLLLGSLTITQGQPAAYAANPGPGMSCTWHRILPGETLGYISRYYGKSVWSVAQINHISNINLIFAGQSLCIAYTTGNHNSGQLYASGNGVSSNGTVHWYDYNALQWSSSGQVATQIRQIAYHYGLSANLLLAIAWQESGWRQHVIARDGGIGVMQLMPLTARGLNAQTGIRYDPYKTWDNIELGAIYLRSLWRGFHGNLVRMISAYNEGGWNVVHRGIFNWRYVDNVLSLMRRY
jgi:Transglycosylase SLT domain/LysM domain